MGFEFQVSWQMRLEDEIVKEEWQRNEVATWRSGKAKSYEENLFFKKQKGMSFAFSL